ncbi:MAG: indole-3-glycerol phosphate synthase TrpC [Coriobacteriales bacterium]|nr:indole-3-glycerol phosphate synthase TrpC [Coriobacteriales bacterium]
MHSILETIVADTRQRVAAATRELPLEQLRTHLAERAAAPPLAPPRPSFAAALAMPGLSFICEVKKASPSKGLIAQDFDPVAIAHAYEEAGANAISVLTEPNFFQGSPRYLTEIASEVGIPVLRKDFIINEYQLYEAAVLGAQAALLIVALLNDDELASFIACAHSLGLDALVEAHTQSEVERALAAGARIVGVNNRDLHSFEVRLETSLTLRAAVPRNVLFVAESGIRDVEDVARLSAAGVDAVLIGETLMRSEDKAELLAQMRGAAG